MSTNKQALRGFARSASRGEWVKESGEGWYSVCSSDDQANSGFIIAHFEGPDSEANREFVQAANPDVVLALLDELETKEEQRANWFQMAEKLGADLDAAERRIAELEARAFNPSLLDVISERQRQRAAEGWTSEHDDAYQNSELADAAACYAIHAHDQGFPTPAHWPWSPDWWKQSGARRDLVKAGALILAEIERIDRAAGITVKGE